jgi:hypothetical protein
VSTGRDNNIATGPPHLTADRRLGRDDALDDAEGEALSLCYLKRVRLF